MLVSLEEKILPDSVTVYLTELFRNNREFKKEFYNLRNYYQGKDLIYADDVFLTAADLIQQKVQQIFNRNLFITNKSIQGYESGAYVKLHRDNSEVAKYTAVVKLFESSNIQGGEAYFARDKQSPMLIPAPVDEGDMLLYGFETYHGVTEITRGERIVLILWLDEGANE